MPLRARDRLFSALLALAGEPGARVLLTGPVEPDGDSIGACLALQRVLSRHGVAADVACDLPWRYDRIPGVRTMVPDRDVHRGYHAVVVLDGDRHRLAPTVAAAFEAAPLRGLIDHHASSLPTGYTHAWIEPTATSTCEMLYRLFVDRGEAIDRDLADQLHAGTLFDTGGLRYTNTTPDTLRMAADLVAAGADHCGLSTRILAERTPGGLCVAGEVFCAARRYDDGRVVVGDVRLAQADRLGLVAGDLEGVVDQLVHVTGAEASALLIERPDGRVKLSLRSRGAVNVAEVAQALSAHGGGHAKAAGATLVGTVDGVEPVVVDRLVRGLRAGRRADAAEGHGA